MESFGPQLDFESSPVRPLRYLSRDESLPKFVLAAKENLSAPKDREIMKFLISPPFKKCGLGEGHCQTRPFTRAWAGFHPLSLSCQVPWPSDGFWAITSSTISFPRILGALSLSSSLEREPDCMRS